MENQVRLLKRLILMVIDDVPPHDDAPTSHDNAPTSHEREEEKGEGEKEEGEKEEGEKEEGEKEEGEKEEGEEEEMKDSSDNTQSFDAKHANLSLWLVFTDMGPGAVGHRRPQVCVRESLSL